jgi:hypothetical protein
MLELEVHRAEVRKKSWMQPTEGQGPAGTHKEKLTSVFTTCDLHEANFLHRKLVPFLMELNAYAKRS